MAPSILLIDADADSIRIYSLMLEHHGYEVISAADTTTGFQLAMERRPSLVISEVFLPPTADGTLLERLRGNEQTAGTPMIVLDSTSSFGCKPGEAKSATRTLSKPCEPSRLLQEVNLMLGGVVAGPPS